MVGVGRRGAVSAETLPLFPRRLALFRVRIAQTEHAHLRPLPV